MSTFVLNDFSAGWTPSDDAVSGRRNGFLRMSNVELDQNGALVLTTGPRKSGSVYPALAHTIYSKLLSDGSLRTRYVADIAGDVYRNNVELNPGTPGSVSRAAFGSGYGFNFIASGDFRVKDNGTTLVNLGLNSPTIAPTATVGVAGVLNGDLEYVFILVSVNGAYEGKSNISDKATVTATDDSIDITTQDPTLVESQANQVWVYRRGGKLDRYYRVKVLTSSTGWNFNDNLSDIDAYTGGKTLNDFAIQVNTAGIPEDILAMAGLVNGRMIYCTAKSIYFSDINSPDSTDSRTTLNNFNSNSEQFLFICKAGENIVFIGTTREVYIIVGTYVQQPNGILDVQLRPLGTSFPPISIDCTSFDGNIVYCAADGWRVLSSSGQSISLTSPNVDRLYRGQTCHDYGGVPIFTFPAVDSAGVTPRYPCCISRNKLWVSVPTIVDRNPGTAFSRRMEVYDFQRKYWRPMGEGEEAPILLFAEDDFNVLSFFEDKYLRDFDYWADNNKLKDTTDKIEIDLLTPIFDGGTPNRKELLTLKAKVETGGDEVTFYIVVDDYPTAIELGTVSTSTYEEFSFDLGQRLIDIFGDEGNVKKTFQIYVTGEVGDFILSYYVIEHQPHPEKLTYLRIGPTNFGTTARKRIPTVPFLLDTMGNTVRIYPFIDGLAYPTLDVITPQKKSVDYYFATDAVGRDFEFILRCIGDGGVIPPVDGGGGGVIPGGDCDSEIEDALYPLCDTGLRYSDDFARANSDTIGSPWIEEEAGGSTQLGISSSMLIMRGVNTQGALAVYDTFPVSECQFSQLTFQGVVHTTGNPIRGGVCVRQDGITGGSARYALTIVHDTVGGYLLKVTFETNGGVTTTFWSEAATINVGDIFKLMAITGPGSVELKAYQNDVQVGSTVVILDSAMQFIADGQCGVCQSPLVGIDIGNIFFNSWRGGALKLA